jgi:hypothetical protein
MPLLRVAGIILIGLAPLVAAAGATAVVHGTISKVDSDAKTIVVKATDGTAHTLHVTAKTTVHGAEATAHGTDVAAKDALHGLREGSEVVAHYTVTGTEKTADEVDKVGTDGMKAVDGTITHLDRGGKKMVVKAADGTEHAFTLTDHAAVDAGKDLDEAATKSAHVTVYYTETAGKKIAHFFERK